MSVKTKNGAYTIQVVDTSKTVILTIEIGNAQIGGSGLNWTGSTDSLGKGEITGLNLGKGSDVKGKSLDLFTNVLDSNSQTNKVVVTYTFENGNPSTVVLNDSVDNDGDIMSFVNKITFN
jgi:hypothetical protein